MPTKLSNDTPHYWSTPVTAIPGGITNLLAVEGTNVLLQSGSAITALDTLTGLPLKISQGYPYNASQPIALGGGHVYIATSTQIQARQLGDGVLAVESDGNVWQVPVGGQASVISTNPDGGCRAAVKAADGTYSITAIAVDATPLWTIPKLDTPDGQTALDHGTLLYVSGGCLVGVDVAHNIERYRTPDPNRAATDPVTIAVNPPLVSGRIVIALGTHVLAFSEATGKYLWTADAVTSGQWQGVVVSDEVLAVMSGSQIVAINLANGETLAAWTMGGASALLVEAGQLYVVAGLELISLNVSDGSSTSKVYMGGPANWTMCGAGLFVAASPVGVTTWDLKIGTAARLNGAQTVVFDGAGELDWANDPFTLEGWVNTTQAGTIACGYPAKDPHGSAFVVALSNDGRIRFGVGPGDMMTQSDVAQSEHTSVLDGTWHHVAVARNGTDVAIYFDGKTLPVQTLQIRPDAKGTTSGIAPGSASIRRLLAPYRPQPILAVGSDQQLLLGGTRNPQTGTTSGFFNGGLREVRLWDVALEGDNVRQRMNRALVGLDSNKNATDPHLVVNLHLNSVDKKNKVANDVSGTKIESVAWPTNGIVPADLELDPTWPYVVEPSFQLWPANEQWTSRAEAAPDGPPPVRTTDGVLAWTSNGILVGVDAISGTSCFELDELGSCSPPFASGPRLYAVTQRHGVVSVNPRSGDWSRIAAFGELRGGTNARVVANEYWIAACDGTELILAETSKPDVIVKVWNVTAFGGQLALNDDRLVITAGAVTSEDSLPIDNGPTRLYSIDLKTSRLILTTASSVSKVVLFNESLFCIGTHPQVTGNLFVLNTDGTLRVAPENSVVQTMNPRDIVASPNGDLLIALQQDTKATALYGLSTGSLSIAWSVDNAIRAVPTTSTLPALTMAGRFVVVTVSDGTLYWIDTQPNVLGDGGVNLVRNVVQLNTPLATPAFVHAGTAFVGSTASSTSGHITGAMHCVVVGETLALFNGCDYKGDWESTGALIAATGVDDPMPFDSPAQWTVEAWIRTTEGGRLLTIVPCTLSQYGFTLDVFDSSVVLTYSWAAGDATNVKNWKTLKTTVETQVPQDGNWHHIAFATRHALAGKVRAYLDGTQIHPTSNTTTAYDTSQGDLSTTYAAYLGSARPAAGSTTAVSSFIGAIADIRLWDRGLNAQELSDEMHLTLTGDEPDLVSWWNFTSGTPDDGARDHIYDAQIVGDPERQLATFGLVNLSFEAPSYATVSSSGSMEDVDAGALYKLTLDAHTPDGAGLPNRQLKVWYVQHPKDYGTAPDSVEVIWTKSDGTVMPPVTLQRLSPEDPRTDTTCMIVTTDDDGKVDLSMTTALRNQGPEFDVNADFMSKRSFVHVQTLLNRRNLVHEPPGNLLAQASLIQDYDWRPGTKMSSKLSKSTWRVSLTASSATGAVLPGETLLIWADQPVNLRCGTQITYVDQHTHAVFTAGGTGEISLVFDADSVNPPHLNVWAGFMNPDDVLVVDPSADSQKKLTAIQGGDMTDTTRLQNWDPVAPKRGALLTDPAAVTASGEVADAVGAVMGATAPAADAPQRFRASTSTAKYRFGPFGEPLDRGLPGNAIRTVRTMRHIQRRMPSNTDGFVAAVARIAPGAIGVNFKTDPKTGAVSVSFPTALPKESENAPPPPMILRSWWKDAWDSFVDAVKDAAEAVEEFLITVGEALESALRYADGLVRGVVASVRDALNAVVAFFEELGVAIMELVNFLMSVFDWGAIMNTYNVIRKSLTAMGTAFNWGMEKLKKEDPFQKMAEQLKTAIEAWLGGTPSLSALEGATVASTAKGDANASLVECTKGDEANWMNRKMEETDEPESGGTVVESTGDNPPDAAVKLNATLENLNPAALLKFDSDAWIAFLRAVADDAIDLFAETADSGLDMMITGMQAMASSMDETIDIPFVSDLFEWITDTKLTGNNFAALACTLPIHFGWAAATLVLDLKSLGKTGRFGDDFPDMPDDIAAMFSDSTTVRASVDEVGAYCSGVAFSITQMIAGIFQSASDFGYLTRNMAALPGRGDVTPKRILLVKALDGFTSTIGGVFKCLEKWLGGNGKPWANLDKDPVGLLTLGSMPMQFASGVNAAVKCYKLQAFAGLPISDMSKGLSILQWQWSLYAIGSGWYSFSRTEQKPGDVARTCEATLFAIPGLYRPVVIFMRCSQGLITFITVMTLLSNVGGGIIHWANLPVPDSRSLRALA